MYKSYYPYLKKVAKRVNECLINTFLLCEKFAASDGYKNSLTRLNVNVDSNTVNLSEVRFMFGDGNKLSDSARHELLLSIFTFFEKNIY